MPTPAADAPAKRTIRWYKLDKPVDQLDTDVEHEVTVQREAIPLILVPGIMGSRLRQAATGLVVWDPPDGIGSGIGALWSYNGQDAAERKRRMIGPDFNEGFLTVDSHSAEKLEDLGVTKGQGAEAQAHGWGEVHWSSYGGLLNFLRSADFGPLRKIFAFPVYAVGYNWTASNRAGGKRVATRIDEIIAENNNDRTFCERVIMITHSMGGLATRSALLLHSAAPKMLGVLHGVQPVTGAPAAYKRMKAGAEGVAQMLMGRDAAEVTAVLANAPGGLELLPTTDYVNSAGEKAWLFVNARGGQSLRRLPASDPYSEIYQERTQFYRLVTPEFVNPDATGAPTQRDGWQSYLQNLNAAKSFHQSIKLNRHDKTYTCHGIGTKYKAWDRVEWIVSRDAWFSRTPSAAEVTAATAGQMPWKATDGNGKEKLTIAGVDGDFEAKLQDPVGEGDGTVPARSGDALQTSGAVRERTPVDGIDHQSAYDNATVRAFTTRVVSLLAKEWFETRPRG
jgi:pimeloyl-ACP methyl ester carboxylesterase